jgi:murein DD-endopeptidase MepM/ murein hydrolase activator NlpD
MRCPRLAIAATLTSLALLAGAPSARAGRTATESAAGGDPTATAALSANGMGDRLRTATASLPGRGGQALAAVGSRAAPAHFEVADLDALLARAIEPTGLLTVVPVPGDSTSPFGYREHPILHRIRYHAGIDMHARRGTLVRAAGPGVVTHAGRMGGYGKMVIIDHGRGLETRYAHLGSYDVRVGDQVEAGEGIARVGSTGRTTGPHLHFEVRRFGHPIDPDLELPIHRAPIERGAGS